MMNIIDKIRKFGLIAATAFLAACMSSCDMQPEDRFVEMGSVKMERTVLLMDFTGQKCVNCPAAHEVIQELVKQYGDTALIAVSIHGGALATSVDRTNFERNNVGLMIPEGAAMNDAFGINSWPRGAVDKINAPGAALPVPEWAGAIRNAIQVPTDIHLEIAADLVDNNIKVKTSLFSGSDTDVSLQVWVVEDNIVTRQETKNGRVDDYIHNNVLRYVAYDVSSGFPMSLKGDVWSVNECDIPVKYTDKERWNTDNLSIVAFAFRGTDICNSAKVKVVRAD